MREERAGEKERENKRWGKIEERENERVHTQRGSVKWDEDSEEGENLRGENEERERQRKIENRNYKKVTNSMKMSLKR